MNRAALAGLACAMAAIFAGGCGYTTHSSLDPKYQTIAVPAFLNQSKEYDLQAALTNAVIRKFTADGRLQVASPDHADLVIEGVILDYRLRGLFYGKQDEITQYVCVVTVGVRLTDRATGQVLWQDPKMTSETSFYTGTLSETSDRLRGNAAAFLAPVRSFATEAENRGVSEALEQLASDILYRTVDPW